MAAGGIAVLSALAQFYGCSYGFRWSSSPESAQTTDAGGFCMPHAHRPLGMYSFVCLGCIGCLRTDSRSIASAAANRSNHRIKDRVLVRSHQEVLGWGCSGVGGSAVAFVLPNLRLLIRSAHCPLRRAREVSRSRRLRMRFSDHLSTKR